MIITTLSVRLKRTLALGTLAFGMSVSAASAMTYTAVTSGDFSNNTTWGGVAPSASITSDVIVIPNGITVTLDQNEVFNGATAVLSVAGTLNSNVGKALILNNTAILGSGTISVDSLVLSTSSGFGFTGNISAKNMASTGTVIATAATVTVTNMLHLTAGTVSVNAGSLNMANNSTIEMSGGNLRTFNTGTLGLTNTYNVMYVGSNNLNGGIELTGSGLKNIEVATASANGVALATDMTVHGMLTLTSGSLRLNGRNLTFGANSDFSASGSGAIVSGNTSNVTFNGNGPFSGGVRFRADSNTVKDLLVNMSLSNLSGRLGTHLNVAGALTLQNGRLDIDTNLLALQATGSAAINGGSLSSYVLTRGTGRLGLNVAAGSSAIYYVGTDNYYAPAIVEANTANASGMLSVGVNDSVRAQGTTGAALSATKKMVNATWHVTSALASNIDINLIAMWSASMELNGFNRSQAYLSHYTGGLWDVNASAASTVAANGMHSMSRNNITTLSPFAVVDKDYQLGISKYAANSEVRIYPNPAGSTLCYSSKHSFSHVDIYNAAGSLVKSLPVVNNTVNIEALAAGSYFANFHGKDGVFVKQFSKL